MATVCHAYNTITPPPPPATLPPPVHPLVTFLCFLCPQIYFWEVTEEGRIARTSSSRAGSGGQRVGWKPHGRLLAVVPKAHDGALADMCYLPHGEDRVSAGPRRRTGKHGSFDK